MLKICINEMTYEDWLEEYSVKGATLTQLAKHFGVNPTTIINRLEKEGIPRNRCGNKPTLGVSKAALEDAYIVRGLSFASIAKYFECSEASIRRLIDTYRIERRPPPKQVLTREFLVSQLSQGYNAYKISEHTGISVPTVYKYLGRVGLAPTSAPSARTFSSELERGIAEEYERGSSTVELAAKYNVSAGCINSALSRQQVDIRTPQYYQRVLPCMDSLAKMYFEEGLSIQQIADKFGVSKVAVWFKIEHLGLRSKSEALSGSNNGMFEAHHSKKARSKMSKAYLEGVREYPSGNHSSWGAVIETPHQGQKRTRSGWETLVAEYFWGRGIDYYYEPETFALTSSKGVDISYLPDFYLPGEDLYIEIKGYNWRASLDKVRLFREQTGNSIDVWRKADLQKLGIL